MKQAVTPLRLGSDRISSLLVRYAIPSIIAMTSSSLYNIVDSIFIGHGVGPIAISGVALSMPLMNIASAFGSLIGIGAAARTSIRLGQGRREAAEGVLGNVVLLNFLVAALFTAVGLLLLDPILCFFGASDATIGYARDFMQIILGGTIVTHMYLSLNEVIRASGYPRRAMAIMLTAVVLNCLLNPLFIFGFGWGIRGSAAATVLAQAAALSVSLIHFSSRGSFIRFERGIFRLQASVVGKIFSIGMASFLLHLCASAVVIVVNKSLREYGGDVAIGAYGIIYRVAMLFLMIVSGLNQGMQPIVGYNYGSGRYNRLFRTFRIAAGAAVLVSTIGTLGGVFDPRPIAAMFMQDEQQIQSAVNCLRITLVSFWIVGFQIVTTQFFQALGMAGKAVFLSLTRQIIFMIPLLFILPPIMGLDGVWTAFPISDIVATVVAACLLWVQIRNIRRRALEHEHQTEAQIEHDI